MIEKLSDYPESDPRKVSEFYHEPMRRKKENERYRKEVLDMAFEAVDMKELDKVKAGSRERGLYLREMKAFQTSEMAAGKVSLSEGAFAGKEYNTVLQGFRQAIKKLELEDTYRVIGKADEKGIYLFTI
jgi:hypothetical protein